MPAMTQFVDVSFIDGGGMKVSGLYGFLRRTFGLLATAAIFVVVASAFVAPFAGNARAAAVWSVEVDNNAFSPSTLMGVQVGDTVTWYNNDTVSHTVTSYPPGSVPLDSPTLSPGETWSYTFTSDGTYEYYCTIHTTMRGTVVVGGVIPEFSSSLFVVASMLVLIVGLIALRRRR